MQRGGVTYRYPVSVEARALGAKGTPPTPALPGRLRRRWIRCALTRLKLVLVLEMMNVPGDPGKMTMKSFV